LPNQPQFCIATFIALPKDFEHSYFQLDQYQQRMDSTHQWALREEEPHITYRQGLGEGGYGEVHEVRLLALAHEANTS
jgi:hypothetical protein